MLELFNGVVNLCQGTGGLIMAFLGQRCKWKQEWFVIIGITSTIIKYVLLGVATSITGMIAGAVVSSFVILADPAVRAIGANSVAPQDQCLY